MVEVTLHVVENQKNTQSRDEVCAGSAVGAGAETVVSVA